MEAAPPYYLRGEATESKRLRFQDLGAKGRWPEVDIEAPAHRLAGRMDLVEKLPNRRVLVRDFKTGRTNDHAGTMLAHIVTQMRLYALAIAEIDPGALVELRVSDATDHKVPVDTLLLEETATWLESVLAGLPAGRIVSSDDLASPGPECALCQYRLACPTYLRDAPRLWKSGTDRDRMPFDIWGEVLAITSEDNRWKVDILDAAGRRVRLSPLDDRHRDIDRLRPGKRLWAFGLAAMVFPVRGRWYHPRNFYELPSERNQSRAWSSVIFDDAD